MGHQEQIDALVREAILMWEQSGRRGRDGFAAMWVEVRRRLRGLRDTATSLAEDQQTALRLLQRLQIDYRPTTEEAPAD